MGEFPEKQSDQGLPYLATVTITYMIVVYLYHSIYIVL